MPNEFVARNGIIALNNSIVTGSLNVTNGITGSLQGTSSWANNVTSFPLNLTNPPSNGDLLIYDSDSSAWENSKSLTGSYELSGSFTTRGENIVCGSLIITNNSTISGSLIVGNDLTVFGASTLLNLTSSQIDLGTSTLTFNVFSPAVRYGGIAVYDSGSTPSSGSGSFIYDTFSKDWISVNDYGSGVTSSAVLLGPQTFNNQGSETYLTANRLPKGTGTAHLNDSNIYDDGSILKSVYSGADIGLRLDFTNNRFDFGNTNYGIFSRVTQDEFFIRPYNGNQNGLYLNLTNKVYQLGQLVGGNQTRVTIDDASNTLSISGSTTITGSLSVTNLSAGTGSGDVIMYNTASGEFFFTASSAIGGGNASNDNFQQIFLLMGG